MLRSRNARTDHNKQCKITYYDCQLRYIEWSQFVPLAWFSVQMTKQGQRELCDKQMIKWETQENTEHSLKRRLLCLFIVNSGRCSIGIQISFSIDLRPVA